MKRLSAELGIRHALYFTKEAANWRELLPNGECLTDIYGDTASLDIRSNAIIDGPVIGTGEVRIREDAVITHTSIYWNTRPVAFGP